MRFIFDIYNHCTTYKVPLHISRKIWYNDCNFFSSVSCITGHMYISRISHILSDTFYSSRMLLHEGPWLYWKISYWGNIYIKNLLNTINIKQWFWCNTLKGFLKKEVRQLDIKSKVFMYFNPLHCMDHVFSHKAT